MSAPLLEVEGLRTHFFTKGGVVKAVDDVTFSVARGEVVGLVGESGSGKSMTGYSILGLVDPPGRIVSGHLRLHGRDLRALSDEDLRQLRGNRIAMIFQDPMMTLNPVLRIDAQMIETILAHRNVGRVTAREQARAALAKVGIPSPDERLSAFPHQFSGGMRQRVAIAIALLNEPDLVIADEPTTALDVTIQGQILFEMQKLVRDTGAALIWITHDLSVIAGLADRVCVMYAGRIVEQGTVVDVLSHPRHPYTRGLLDSVPAMSPRGSAARADPRDGAVAPRVAGGLRVSGSLRPRYRRVRADARDAVAGRPRAESDRPLPPSAARGASGVNTETRETSLSAAAGAGLVELRGVSKRFVKPIDIAARIGNLAGRRRAGRGRARRRRRGSGDSTGRSRRTRRRVRLRQIDAGTLGGGTAPADRVASGTGAGCRCLRSRESRRARSSSGCR